MAEDKKGFILYTDITHVLHKMPMDKRGELFTMIVEYVNDEEPETEDLMVELVFEPIKQQLKRDLKSWESRRKDLSASGRKGGLARASKARKKQANQAVSVNANANDSVIQSKEEPTHDLWGSQGIKPPKDALMCQAYFQSQKEKHKYKYDTEPTAIAFFEHYAAKGWKVNGDKITNWQLKENAWARSQSDFKVPRKDVDIGF